MFAVVRAGGAQFKVRGGDRIRVSFMPEKNPKDQVQLSPLALEAEEDFLLGGDLKSASVTAMVLCHGLGKKILVFKKKRRKGYRRTRGHRQAWTDLQITEIKSPDGKILFQEKAASPGPLKKSSSPQVKTPSAKTLPASADGQSLKKPVRAEAEKPVKGKKSSAGAKQTEDQSRRASDKRALDNPPSAEVKAEKETKKGKTPLPD